MSVTPDEGNPKQPGEQSPSTPAASENGSQPLPDYVKTILATLDEHGKLIKGVQKGADKQIGQVRADVKRILELKESGMTEAQIQRELEIDQLLSDRTPGRVEKAPDKEQPANGFDSGVIDTALGLPANDTRVTDLKLKYGNNPVLYVQEAAKLKASFQNTPPSPAEQLPPEGAIKRSEKTAAQLEADYQKEAKEIASSKQGDERIRAISSLKAKYRQMGLDKR